MGAREVTPLEYLKDAALGDDEAQIRLAKAALTASEMEDANRLVLTVEGLTFARLAASRGNLVGLGLVVTFQAQLAELMADRALFDESDRATGAALGAADMALDQFTDPSLGEILGSYLSATERADPDSQPSAAAARRFWEGR